MTEEELENFNIPKSVLIKKCIQLEKQLTKKDKRIADLEKENAELKEKYAKNITDCDICDTYCNSQLTKAIEIIEGLMRFCRCFAQHHTEDIRYKEAEQFLSEVEK